jgi:hypothetical protein
MEHNKHILIGCSFTDPRWQQAIPWSMPYSKHYPSYVVAQAGMGIKGICTEALYYLQDLENIEKAIIMLPTIWRMDIELDEEVNYSNAMTDLLYSYADYKVHTPAVRKWLISGGLHYSKNKPEAKIFDIMYRQQGFKVIAKEHFRALKMLLNYLKERKIQYYITAIKDPMDQLEGLDYIKDEFCKLLNDVEYDNWIRFDGQFIDKFLGHPNHPSTEEHQVLCQHIVDSTN